MSTIDRRSFLRRTIAAAATWLLPGRPAAQVCSAEPERGPSPPHPLPRTLCRLLRAAECDDADLVSIEPIARISAMLGLRPPVAMTLPAGSGMIRFAKGSERCEVLIAGDGYILWDEFRDVDAKRAPSLRHLRDEVDAIVAERISDRLA